MEQISIFKVDDVLFCSLDAQGRRGGLPKWKTITLTTYISKVHSLFLSFIKLMCSWSSYYNLHHGIKETDCGCLFVYSIYSFFYEGSTYIFILTHNVWKSPRMSHLNFWILAFSTGNFVWPQASGFQKLAKLNHFWHF